MGAMDALFGEVSTHSRLKAAGSGRLKEADKRIVSTHSRLKAAGILAATIPPS